MIPSINTTFGTTPILSARIVREPLRTHCQIRVPQGAPLASTLELSDGVQSLRLSGLVLQSRETLGDGSESITLAHSPALPTREEQSAAFFTNQSFVIAVNGTRVLQENQRVLPELPSLRLAYEQQEVKKPSAFVAIAPNEAVLERLSDDWQPVVQNASGRWVTLDEALQAYGIDDDLFHDLLLHQEDRDALGIAPELAARLLSQAYRCFRFVGEMPEGLAFSVASLEHQASLFSGRPGPMPLSEHGPKRASTASLTADRQGKLILKAASPLWVLKEKAKGSDPYTTHGYRVHGRAPIDALIEFRRAGQHEVTRVLANGDGDAEEIFFPSLVGFRDRASGSSNHPRQEEVRRQCTEALNLLATLWPERIEGATYSGVHDIAPTRFERVEIMADAKGGMRTLVKPRADWRDELIAEVDAHFFAPSQADDASHEARVESEPRPRNAWRGGPLVIRDDANDPPLESFAFASLADVDPQSGALALDHFGRLAQPFWINAKASSASGASEEEGAWFLAAPVKVTDKGLSLLDDHITLAEHEAVSRWEAAGDQVPMPKGSDGLLLQGLDGQTHLAFFDRSLVAQHRGSSFISHSSAIREIKGEWLDPTRVGALHQLTMVTLSPMALKESSGTGVSSAWVAALNFRDASTATPDQRKHFGRGRFVELSGTSIGQLAHAPNKAGPIIADAAHCTKHSLGSVTESEGIFRECAGHIATDAFFKMPGLEDFDAPWLFQEDKTKAKPASGHEYRAEIKLDESLTHEFYGRPKEGRWVVTYRLPFRDAIPLHWKPQEDPPLVIDRNIAGPSYDWVPPYRGAPEPEDWDELEEIPYEGPVLSATGYALTDEEGVPHPAEGGGVAMMPGGVKIADGPDYAFDGAMRWLTLHPSVGFGFGLPDMDVDGAPREGYRLAMVDDALVLSASPDLSGDGLVCLNAPLELKQGFAGDTPSVTGSRSDGSALQSLLSALDALGLIDDQSVA